MSNIEQLRGNEKWGVGVPNYTAQDLMTEEELLDFGIQIVLQYGTKTDGYEIVSVNNKKDCFPNIVLKKGDDTYFVLVKTDEVHCQPVLSDEVRQRISKHAQNLGAIPLFASVGIGACDPERFEKRLMLRNDAFYANFTGFETIKDDGNLYSERWTEEDEKQAFLDRITESQVIHNELERTIQDIENKRATEHRISSLIGCAVIFVILMIILIVTSYN